MKYLLLPVAVFFACSSSGVPATSDRNEGEVLDASSDIAESMDSQGTLDIEADQDAPEGCASYLPKTQCVANENCLDFEACLGSFSCKEPPCYGLCDAFPGLCAPKPTPKSCAKKSDCPSGFLCQRFSPSKPDIRGICVQSPSSTACFLQEDCEPSFRCAWANVCDPFDICLGADYPGRCLPAPPDNACYEDKDCKADEHCENAHVCAFDDEACVSKMGECKSGAPFGCKDDSDCTSGSSSGFCIGSFACNKPQCPISDRKGFCATPVVAQCYTDAFCSKNYLCVSTFPCPPQTTCAQRGYPGFCLSVNDVKASIAVSVEGEDFSVGKTLYALMVNQSAIPVFLDPCYAGFLQVKDSNGIFQDLKSTIGIVECNDHDPIRLITLSPGKGFAIPFDPGFPGTYRIETIFKIGCEQGVYNPTCVTTPQPLKVDSMAFEVH